MSMKNKRIIIIIKKQHSRKEKKLNEEESSFAGSSGLCLFIVLLPSCYYHSVNRHGVGWFLANKMSVTLVATKWFA